MARKGRHPPHRVGMRVFSTSAGSRRKPRHGSRCSNLSRFDHAISNDFVGALPAHGAHSLSVAHEEGRPIVLALFDRYDFGPVVDRWAEGLSERQSLRRSELIARWKMARARSRLTRALPQRIAARIWSQGQLTLNQRVQGSDLLISDGCDWSVNGDPD